MYSFIYNIYYIFIYMCVYKYSFLMSGILCDHNSKLLNMGRKN